MPRNIERDHLREQDRRNRLIEAAFRLFSEKTIEAVSLQQVATESGVSIATLYSYYQNKINLVTAVSAAKWGTCWQAAYGSLTPEQRQRMSVLEWIEFYCDQIISLYHNNPGLLRFSSNFKTYICRENVPKEALEEQNRRLMPMQQNFHVYYTNSVANHSIRSDIPEAEMFITITHTMLAMAERYAIGLAWADNNTHDHTAELNHLRDMLLQWSAAQPVA